MLQPDFVSWLAVLAASAGLSAGLILILKPILVRHLLAHPNARSSHATATPQGAGLAVMASLTIVCATAVALNAVPPPSLVPVLAGAAVLTVVGALDDAHALEVSWRLLAQTLVALAIVFMLPQDFRLLPDLLPLGVERALMVLGVVGFVNAINFLDGLDWMTVAQVVPMTLGVAILCWLGVVPASIGLLALALLGATLGFAVFNKHPAQIFLGDAGSLPIGLVLAYMLIYVAEAHIVSGLLLALYSLTDTTLTLVRRLIQRRAGVLRAQLPFLSAGRGARLARATSHGAGVWLWLVLADLAIAAALARSLAFDIAALALGLAATGFVLFNFTRGR